MLQQLLALLSDKLLKTVLPKTKSCSAADLRQTSSLFVRSASLFFSL